MHILVIIYFGNETEFAADNSIDINKNKAAMYLITWVKDLTICFILLTLFFLSMGGAVAEEGNEGGEASSEQNSEEQSTQKENQPPRVGGLNMEALQQQFLADEFKSKEVVWLEVEYPLPEGEAPAVPASTIKVLALKQESQKAQKHGAVLILHDKEQHADWPILVRPLRTSLPKSGWFTLSVNLPYEKQYVDDVPDRNLPVKKFDEVAVTDAMRMQLLSRLPTSGGSSNNSEESSEGSDENADDGSDQQNSEEAAPEDQNSDQANGGESDDNEPDSSVDIDLADAKPQPNIPYNIRALAHLQTAAEYIQKEGYQNIVILAYGASADVVLEYIEARKGQFSERGFALVMIDPRLSTEYEEDILKAFGQNFPAPVLDLITQKEEHALSLAKERNVSAAVGGVRGYKQLFLPETREIQSMNATRRIRFWLEKYAPGMLVKGR